MSNCPVQIVADGVVVTTSGTSQSLTIPNTSGNTKPRAIRVAATAATHVQLFKDGTGQATTADTLVQPGDAITLSVPYGMNNIAAIQSAASGLLQVSPLEDQ